MNLTTLTSTDLKNIGKLLAQKETLVAQVARIDRQLSAYGTGKPAAAAAKVPAARAVQRRDIKGEIVDLLKKAGKDGLKVKDLATRLKVAPNRIYTWFYGTGKNVKQIKKVGEAKYRWEA
jgi:hypothetical protein